MNVRTMILTSALAAVAVMGYAASPETPMPEARPGPSGSAPSGSMPVSERTPEERSMSSADEAVLRGELARRCNDQARLHRLNGDDRRVFMVQCMHR